MKRAKIMLMAIAVLGVVGGAVAFKAKNFTTAKFYYPTVKTSTSPCTVSGEFAFVTTNVGTSTVYYSTAYTTLGCPTFTKVSQ